MDEYEGSQYRILRHFDRPKNVLVADDDAVIRLFLSQFFQKNNCTVFEAEDGEQALSIYRERNKILDLCVIDLKMPMMSGADVVKNIRAANKKIPIIIFTGYPEEKEISSMLNSGWITLVSKLIDFDDLQNIFASLFENK